MWYKDDGIDNYNNTFNGNDDLLPSSVADRKPKCVPVLYCILCDTTACTHSGMKEAGHGCAQAWGMQPCPGPCEPRHTRRWEGGGVWPCSFSLKLKATLTVSTPLHYTIYKLTVAKVCAQIFTIVCYFRQFCIVVNIWVAENSTRLKHCLMLVLNKKWSNELNMFFRR